VIICQVSTAVPENMTHESHFRAMLQALHHSLVLEDMLAKQVKTVSTFNIATSYSLFCLSVYSTNPSDQIFSNVIVCVCVCFVTEAPRTSEAKSPRHRMLIERNVKKWLNSLWSMMEVVASCSSAFLQYTPAL